MAAHPLRVLLTDPHLKGGGQVRYVVNLAGQLIRNGHQVWIGCKRGSVLASMGAEAGAGIVEAFHFRNGLHPKLLRDDFRTLRRFIAAERPDILHASGSQDHWTAAAVNRWAGRSVCVVRTRHNTYPVAAHWPNRVLNRDWTDYQIIVCDFVRRTLAESPAFDAARMTAIHNGVDAEAFRPDPEARAAARKEFGYGPDHLVVGIAARLVADKGHRFLFEAVASLSNSFPALRLLILGQGPLEDDLRSYAAELGISGIVAFAGFRDDAARCVQAFDIGVQPSIDCDTSSFSLKEQMACEKAVVASDYGGLPEIVSDGIEGRVVPAGQSAPLAEALRGLLADSSLRAQMGEAGRRRVLRDFTVETFAERTVAAYRRAIEVHRDRTTPR